MTNLDDVISEVKKREVPTLEEREEVLKLAEMLQARVEEEAQKHQIDVESRVEGSIAKDTWLRSDKDVDIFLLFHPSLEREKLSTLGLKIAEASVREYGGVKRYAEHPYIESRVGDLKVNIVPCYKVELGRWKSSTDRTPFHTEYIKARLRSAEQKTEVRLLKRFMKGVGVYGADIKTGGFSGYLAELLILNSGDFVTTLKAASMWREGELIDIEGHYKDRVEDAKRLFDDPLIVVDPVDWRRNVASALKKECFNTFRAASKYFLKAPNLAFFYPPQPKPLTQEELRRILIDRGADLIFVILENIEAVPDILWGQLYKTLKSLGRLLRQHDFKLLRSTAWSDERKYSILIFEVESNRLSRLKKHLGPPVSSADEEKFLAKHNATAATGAGPWIEADRWAVLKERKFSEAEALLTYGLTEGVTVTGIPSRVAKAAKEGVEILLNEEIEKFYRKQTEFNVVLVKFLDGRPGWLEQADTVKGASR
ncbi:MAG: CCA tRNA nucleotidyltransferase [Candidatus Bathyarchaeia archaeon]